MSHRFGCLAVAASDAVEGCEQPLERPVRLVRLVVEDEVGKGYVEVVRELVGDRGGDVGEEALRVSWSGAFVLAV